MSRLPDRSTGHRPPEPVAAARGCTLVEVLVATTCLIVALALAAQVYGSAARAARRASQITRATLLAQGKMEELVSRAADGGLAESPPDALVADVAGCFDVVDGFVRRWSIESLPAAPVGALVIHVFVAHNEYRASPLTAAVSAGAHLVTVRRRAS
jgi:hypothetical protein